MSHEDNGNLFTSSTSSSSPSKSTGQILLKPTSSSTEDLSEYTDADESISAPTEFLAEFLSAVMLKDYETALKYCKLILQYEPNNMTAKEFYPLILEKLQNTYNKSKTSKHSNNDDSYSSDSESNDENESGNNTSSSSSGSDDEDEPEDDVEEEESSAGSGGSGKSGNKHSSDGDGDATTASYSSLEDEEAEMDQLTALAAKYRVDNVDLGNGNKILYSTNATGSTGSKTAPPPPLVKSLSSNITTSNLVTSRISSDSESPTEPISQQTIAILRAKVTPAKH